MSLQGLFILRVWLLRLLGISGSRIPLRAEFRRFAAGFKPISAGMNARKADFNVWPEWFTKSHWWLRNQSGFSASQREVWATEQTLPHFSMGRNIVCSGWQMQSRKPDKAEFLISIPAGSWKEGGFGVKYTRGGEFIFFMNDFQLTKPIVSHMLRCGWSFSAGSPIF